MNDDGMTRRDLIARGAGAVAAAGAAVAGAFLLRDVSGRLGVRRPAPLGRRLRNFFAQVDFPLSNPTISVAIGAEGRMERLVRAAVSGLAPSLGIKRFVLPGDVVLIKPNIGFDRPPYLGATTHPEVLRWVIRMCREAGARRIIVADYPIEAPEVCFAKSGIGRAAKAEGAELWFPKQGDFEIVTVRSHPPERSHNEVLEHWPVFYRPLAEANKVIGVAPIKDHNLCSASMNLKNWYGLLGGRRNQFHQAIHGVISDLALLVSPTLVIADATRVMMSNGPTGGRISDVSPGGRLRQAAVIASVDPVACDAWCYEHLLGRDPAGLAYLELAHRKIGPQIAEGARRLGEWDWRVYARQGRIVTTSV